MPPLRVSLAHQLVDELTGRLLGGRRERVIAGDTVVVDAGATLTVENPTDHTAITGVSTSVGLTAELADGTRITPPWAN